MPESPTPGLPGGIAIYTRVAIKLALTGELWGGGGGGAGGGTLENVTNKDGCGGAGTVPGLKGGATAADGTTEAGGTATQCCAGGNPGLAGASRAGDFPVAGGAAGSSVDGWSYVTTGSWDGTTFTPGALGGDKRGPTVN